MGDTRLDHLALAVWRWSDARATLVDRLGGQWLGGVRMAEYNPCQLSFANGMRVELLEPGADGSSFLARFLARSGAGPHHVTFKVDDIRLAIRRARDAGLQVVRERLGAPEWQEAFLHRGPPASASSSSWPSPASPRVRRSPRRPTRSARRKPG